MRKLFALSLLMLMVSLLSAQKKGAKNAAEVPPPGLLQFSAESNLYKALGTFKQWQFTKISLPKTAPDNLEGLTATLEIDMNSVSERTIRLSQDLKSPDYFDAKKHPKSTVKVLKVKKQQDGRYQAEMEIKLKKTKQVVVGDFEVTSTEPLKVKGEVVLLRQDFKVGMGNNMESIQNEVKVLFDTELRLPQK